MLCALISNSLKLIFKLISFVGSYMTRHHMGRPLSRTLSSPLVALSPIGSPQECQVPTAHTFTTGKNFTFKNIYGVS